MLVNADDTWPTSNGRDGNVTPDGRFFFQNVAPGRYTITARTMHDGAASSAGGAARGRRRSRCLWGSAEVVVAGQDVSDVVIELQRGITVSGQVAFQPTTLTPPADLSGAQVSIFPFTPDQNNFMLMGPPPQGKVDASGKFTISDVMPGKYRMSAG